MQWFLDCLLQKYATFAGRARRKEYWMFSLVSFVIGVILGIAGKMMGTGSIDALFSLATFIPSIAVGVRRMHDVNKSGWYLLFPVYNLVLLCTAGDVGDNPYGPDPKQPVTPPTMTGMTPAPHGQMARTTPAPSMPAYPNNVVQLEKFAMLKAKGVITQQEFDEQKKKLLAS